VTKIISLTILNLVTLNVGAKLDLLFTNRHLDVKQTGLIRWFVERKVKLSCIQSHYNRCYKFGHTWLWPHLASFVDQNV
jgi:hypothetical protein